MAATTTPARYLLFCSFGDAFINQTPSASFVLGIFQVPRQHTTCRDWRPRCTPLFFSSISAFDPSFASRPALTLRPAHESFKTANPRATGFRQSHSTSFQEIRFFERNLSCYDAKLKYRFTRERSSILDLFPVRAVLRIASIYRKSKFLIFANACENEIVFLFFTGSICFIYLPTFLIQNSC